MPAAHGLTYSPSEVKCRLQWNSSSQPRNSGQEDPTFTNRLLPFTTNLDLSNFKCFLNGAPLDLADDVNVPYALLNKVSSSSCYKQTGIYVDSFLYCNGLNFRAAATICDVFPQLGQRRSFRSAPPEGRHLHFGISAPRRAYIRSAAHISTQNIQPAART